MRLLLVTASASPTPSLRHAGRCTRVTHGDHVSKRRAALWACKKLPEWAALIRQVFRWREEKALRMRHAAIDHEATIDDTLRFVSLIAGRAAKI